MQFARMNPAAPNKGTKNQATPRKTIEKMVNRKLCLLTSS